MFRNTWYNLLPLAKNICQTLLCVYVCVIEYTFVQLEKCKKITNKWWVVNMVKGEWSAKEGKVKNEDRN